MGKSKEKTTLKITNLRHSIKKSPEFKELAAQELGLSVREIVQLKILRRAIDARQTRIDFVYTMLATIEAEKAVINRIIRKKNIKEYHEKQFKRSFSALKLKQQPIIIGCGPAGLFTALTLVERGISPLIIEQGQRISERSKTVEDFWERGRLNTDSNVFFGEGGAGTFSDGKLTTRTKSPLKEKVFEKLVDHGAPSEIIYMHKPHIGTDRLRKIIPAIVNEMERKGVQFMFNTRVTDIIISQGRVCGIVAGDTLKTDHVFLATGHSAHDLYRLLQTKGVMLARKDFSVGVRIEHPQEFINKMIFGAWDGYRMLGPADYFMSCKDIKTGRSIYSFCMCPGGYIIGCASQYNHLCTNGMSTYQRNSSWANAAIVVNVHGSDFNGNDPLAGILFQDEIEQRAFKAGGGGFHAPVQRAEDFIKETLDSLAINVNACSYRPGVIPYDLNKILPEFIHRPLQHGLKLFNKKMPGFIEEGLLVGVETRTSSPVRIMRDPQNYHAAGLKGLIPVGEGSGYAGGIMSSAVDGICAAQAFDL